jgi:hypothetical protein
MGQESVLVLASEVLEMERDPINSIWSEKNNHIHPQGGRVLLPRNPGTVSVFQNRYLQQKYMTLVLGLASEALEL